MSVDDSELDKLRSARRAEIQKNIQEQAEIQLQSEKYNF